MCDVDKPLLCCSKVLEARDERRLLRFQKQMAAYNLLLIDELGFMPL
jgi:DNA replication protein DnaC